MIATVVLQFRLKPATNLSIQFIPPDPLGPAIILKRFNTHVHSFQENRLQDFRHRGFHGVGYNAERLLF